jgi:hypothetical protein
MTAPRDGTSHRGTTDAGLWQDLGDAVLVPLTEAQLADELRETGVRVQQHRGRWWQELRPGLWMGVHLGARFRSQEATAPSRRCWAYRARLVEADAREANASMPLHLLADLASFSPASLPATRRQELRRCQRDVRLGQVMDITMMEAEGYEVFRSAQDRTRNPYRSTWPRDVFVERRRPWVGSGARITIAGLVDGRMGGYLCGYAVDSTAYVEIVDVATEALRSGISPCLHAAFIELCQRTEGIREVVNSPHIPEDPGLTYFKTSMGFPVVQVPARLSLAPLVGPIIRRVRPFAHYRLTGRSNPAVERAVAQGGQA